jgi:lipoate synthase
MTRPIIIFHNVETNEVVEREMNDAEFAQYKADEASSLAEQAKAEAKATAKAALLVQLGITEEQAQLLLA